MSFSLVGPGYLNESYVVATYGNVLPISVLGKTMSKTTDWPNVITTLIINNLNNPSSTFPQNITTNPSLKGSDKIYFSIWDDGGYRVYVNPTTKPIPYSFETNTYLYNDAPRVKAINDAAAAKLKATEDAAAAQRAIDVAAAAKLKAEEDSAAAQTALDNSVAEKPIEPPSEVPPPPEKSSSMMYIIIFVLLLAVGGGAFVFMKNKKKAIQSFGRSIARLSRMGKSIRKM